MKALEICIIEESLRKKKISIIEEHDSPIYEMAVYNVYRI